jgi:hypothetical protein
MEGKNVTRGSAATSVGLAAVVRLGTASAEFTSFCLCHSRASVPAGLMYRRPKSRTVDLHANAWVLPEVSVLCSSWERYVGIRADAVSSVMLLTRSIHTFKMHTPLRIMVLNLEGIVVGADVVRPRRIVNFSELRWVVETQADAALPVPGTKIVASTMPKRCLEH